jgi:hypothetical protein
MFAAFDLSKAATGWAVWQPGWDAPRFGHWKLGGEFTTRGQVFCKLQRSMLELHKVMPFEEVVYEEPLLLGPAAGHTTADTQKLLIGLAMHVESFCEAMKIRRCNEINQSSWRKGFIGSVKRGTKRTDLKTLTIERCRAYGWNPSRDDEADSLGVLEYHLATRKIDRPWRDNALFGGQVG